uniref:Spt5 KOW domain-containing protein n=1 Tax=Aegilops tauschii subsp. strangulata TaxID=200361 RepID=A0A453R2C4_AEGTS
FGGGGRGGRGHDALVGKCIKIKSGPYKGYRGRVKEVTGVLVRVELDSLMKIVTVKRDDIADTPTVATPFREPRFSLGSETPMHPSRTPLHPFQTPMRDPGATPIHDGMRTPMRSRAWAPMSPPREIIGKMEILILGEAVQLTSQEHHQLGHMKPQHLDQGGQILQELVIMTSQLLERAIMRMLQAHMCLPHLLVSQ